MPQRCAAKLARVRSRSRGDGSYARDAGKQPSLPGSEYCRDPVFQAMCSACQIQRHPGHPAPASSTNAMSTTSMRAPWQRLSSCFDIDLDVEVTLDALIEDVDDRPYLWDLPEER